MVLKQSISADTPSYAFQPFIAFMALGAAAAALAAFFMLVTRGLEKDFEGCDCHSRQASLSQNELSIYLDITIFETRISGDKGVSGRSGRADRPVSSS